MKENFLINVSLSLIAGALLGGLLVMNTSLLRIATALETLARGR